MRVSTQCFHGTSALGFCTDILAQLTCFSRSFMKPNTEKTYHTLILVQLTFLLVCGHGFPFSIFHFRHVELQPCHTMCISLQGTTALRRLKYHRLEHRLPGFRRRDPKVRSDLRCQLQMVLHASTPLEDRRDQCL